MPDDKKPAAFEWGLTAFGPDDDQKPAVAKADYKMPLRRRGLLHQQLLLPEIHVDCLDKKEVPGIRFELICIDLLSVA